MMPPRLWPTRLWAATIVVGLLLAHAVGLAVHLVFVEQAGGFPRTIGGNAPAASAAVDNYGAHIITGLVPGVILIIFGLVAALPAARDTDVEIAAWGRILLAALAVLTVILAALAYPFVQIGW